MNGEWSLDVLYKGYDDPKFAEDRAAFDAACARMNELAAALDGMEPKKRCTRSFWPWRISTAWPATS